MATLTAKITNVLKEPESGAQIYIMELTHPKAEAVPTPSSIAAGVACQRYGVYIIPADAFSEAVILKASLDGKIYAIDTDNFAGTGAGDIVNFNEEV